MYAYFPFLNYATDLSAKELSHQKSADLQTALFTDSDELREKFVTFFDLETTGLPKGKRKSEDSAQSAKKIPGLNAYNDLLNARYPSFEELDKYDNCRIVQMSAMLCRIVPDPSAM